MTETKKRKMSAAQRRARKRKIRNRRIAMTVALVLVVALASVGGTIAWLTATTAPVTNTFTTSDINITLAETKSDFKMVPGGTIAKDPKVTVVAGSEACYLFVKIDESTNLTNFISYTVATGWTPLSGVSGVYYREVAATTADTAFSVLKDDQVTVNNSVTKDMMNSLTASNYPTLKFTAYACQSAYLSDLNNDGKTDAKDAWEAAKPATTT